MTYVGAVAFVNRIHAVSGRYPILYSGASFLAAQLHTHGVTTPDTTTLSKCPLWIAEYGAKAIIPLAWPHYTLWQYTSTGHCSGVVGNVDRNYFNGDASALKALCQ